MTVTAYNNYLEARMSVVGSYVWNGHDVLIYDDALPAFAKILKRRIKHRLQNVIVVTGSTGSGKSTLAIQLCRAMDSKWGIADNYIYDVEDLKNKLSDPGSSPISLFDEGSISLNSNNSMRNDDKMLVALFDTMRSLGWTSVICIPSIDSLNKRIREYHMDYQLICPSRPLITGYDTRGFGQIFEHRLRDFGRPYNKLIATTLYKPLPPRIDTEYQRIKREHQDRLIQQFIRGDEKL